MRRSLSPMRADVSEYVRRVRQPPQSRHHCDRDRNESEGARTDSQTTILR